MLDDLIEINFRMQLIKFDFPDHVLIGHGDFNKRSRTMNIGAIYIQSILSWIDL